LIATILLRIYITYRALFNKQQSEQHTYWCQIQS